MDDAGTTLNERSHTTLAERTVHLFPLSNRAETSSPRQPRQSSQQNARPFPYPTALTTYPRPPFRGNQKSHHTQWSQTTAEPSTAPMAQFAARCTAEGLCPFIHFNPTRVAPPLVISEQGLVRGLDIIDAALTPLDA